MAVTGLRSGPRLWLQNESQTICYIRRKSVLWEGPRKGPAIHKRFSVFEICFQIPGRLHFFFTEPKLASYRRFVATNRFHF